MPIENAPHSHRPGTSVFTISLSFPDSFDGRPPSSPSSAKASSISPLSPVHHRHGRRRSTQPRSLKKLYMLSPESLGSSSDVGKESPDEYNSEELSSEEESKTSPNDNDDVFMSLSPPPSPTEAKKKRSFWRNNINREATRKRKRNEGRAYQTYTAPQAESAASSAWHMHRPRRVSLSLAPSLRLLQAFCFVRVWTEGVGQHAHTGAPSCQRVSFMPPLRSLYQSHITCIHPRFLPFFLSLVGGVAFQKAPVCGVTVTGAGVQWLYRRASIALMDFYRLAIDVPELTKASWIADIANSPHERGTTILEGDDSNSTSACIAHNVGTNRLDCPAPGAFGLMALSIARDAHYPSIERIFVMAAISATYNLAVKIRQTTRKIESLFERIPNQPSDEYQKAENTLWQKRTSSLTPYCIQYWSEDSDPNDRRGIKQKWYIPDHEKRNFPVVRKRIRFEFLDFKSSLEVYVAELTKSGLDIEPRQSRDIYRLKALAEETFEWLEEIRVRLETVQSCGRCLAEVIREQTLQTVRCATYAENWWLLQEDTRIWAKRLVRSKVLLQNADKLVRFDE
ncbi:hypothetical protein NMY22_g5838 [Coprinellus aureogranulatus]|nr:hypothetical protein NMY22_g5838 [Coprinellus aureogranulatus]